MRRQMPENNAGTSRPAFRTHRRGARSLAALHAHVQTPSVSSARRLLEAAPRARAAVGVVLGGWPKFAPVPLAATLQPDGPVPRWLSSPDRAVRVAALGGVRPRRRL